LCCDDVIDFENHHSGFRSRLDYLFLTATGSKMPALVMS
jgi:hypothetical protein